MTYIHMTVVRDPDLGTIAACVDEDGNVVSTRATHTQLPPTNIQPYLEAVDAFAHELGERYAQLHPDAADRWRRAVRDEWADEA